MSPAIVILKMFDCDPQSSGESKYNSLLIIDYKSEPNNTARLIYTSLVFFPVLTIIKESGTHPVGSKLDVCSHTTENYNNKVG